MRPSATEFLFDTAICSAAAKRGARDPFACSALGFDGANLAKRRDVSSGAADGPTGKRGVTHSAKGAWSAVRTIGHAPLSQTGPKSTGWFAMLFMIRMFFTL